MDEVLEDIPLPVLPHPPLKIHNRLIENVNSWGNVEYNIPLRTSRFETRTGTNVAHRFIPPIPHSLDVKITAPLPTRVCGRDLVVEKETYRTNSSEFDIKPNPNKAMERADCAMNCRNTIYMTSVEKRLQRKTIVQPKMLSEMKDMYRGLRKPLMAPPDIIMKSPDPEYIFPVVAWTRNEVPVIPETSGGFRKLLDPYLSTNRATHRPFTPDEQYGVKDNITFYTESKTPKVRGFGPRFSEIWQPLQAKPHRAVYDRVLVKKECHEVAAAHNAISNIKGRFQTENQLKYKIPFTLSPLATFDHGESFDLAPFPPNPFQTNIAPFMYCSDYCHVSQGTSPYSVIDLYGKSAPPIPHKKCKQNFKVSRDFTV